MPTSGLPDSIYLRMIAICFGRGSAAADAQDQQVGVVERLGPGKSCGDLGSAITNVQRTPSGSSSLAAKAGKVTSVLYSSSPIKKTARGRSSGLNWNAGWPGQVGRRDRRARRTSRCARRSGWSPRSG